MPFMYALEVFGKGLSRGVRETPATAPNYGKFAVLQHRALARQRLGIPTRGVIADSRAQISDNARDLCNTASDV